MGTDKGLERNLCRRTNVGNLFTYKANIVPDKPALKFREKTYTYLELNQSANKLANALLKTGIEKGDRITILSHNCDNYPVIWIACMKIGAILAPINWNYKSDEIMYLMNHCEPTIFFVEDEFIDNIEELKGEIKSVKTYVKIQLGQNINTNGWLDYNELISGEKDSTEPEVLVYDDDPALLMYTSGTESAPKGVLKSHLDIMSSLMTVPINTLYQENDVQLVALPLFHYAGLWPIVSTAAVEGLLVIIHMPELEEILKITQKEKVNIWVWPVTWGGSFFP